MQASRMAWRKACDKRENGIFKVLRKQDWCAWMEEGEVLETKMVKREAEDFGEPYGPR